MEIVKLLYADLTVTLFARNSSNYWWFLTFAIEASSKSNLSNAPICRGPSS
jgi:hypothetical protein